jgi:hypothetical protein
MHIPSPLKITALGLVLSSVAFAQSPTPAPPTPPAIPPAAAPVSTPPQVSMVTESSRVRAFNAGPGGEVRSLYLQNGSVVDLAPGIGGQLGPAVRKGQKITVAGTKSEINGQSLVEAASVRLNDQTFSANAVAPGPMAEVAAPPPPGVPQPPPVPAPRSRNRVAAPAPCNATADAPRHRQVKLGLIRHLRDSKLGLLLRRRAEQHRPRHPTVWPLHRRLKTEIAPDLSFILMRTGCASTL